MHIFSLSAGYVVSDQGAIGETNSSCNTHLTGTNVVLWARCNLFRIYESCVIRTEPTAWNPCSCHVCKADNQPMMLLVTFTRSISVPHSIIVHLIICCSSLRYTCMFFISSVGFFFITS